MPRPSTPAPWPMARIRRAATNLKTSVHAVQWRAYNPIYAQTPAATQEMGRLRMTLSTTSALGDETIYSVGRARAVFLVLAGMALQWAALHSITFFATVFPAAPPEIRGAWAVNSGCTFTIFLAMFILAPRMPGLLQHRRATAAMTVCITTGTGLLILSGTLLPSSLLVLIGNALVACGTTPLILAWGELYRWLDPKNEQLIVTLGAIVLSVGIYFVLIHLPLPLSAVIFMAVPLASVACLLKARPALATLSKTWASRPHTAAPKSPALLYVCIAVFSIPYDFMRSSSNLDVVFADTAAWSQVLAVTVVILVGIAWAETVAEKRGVLLVPLLVLMLLSAAMVLPILVGQNPPVAASSLLYSGYYLFLAMIYLALGPVVATTSTNPLRLFAGAMIANVGGLLLGSLLGSLSGLLGSSVASMVVLGITYTIFIVGILLLNPRSYSVFRVNFYDGDKYSFEYLVPLAPMGSQAAGAMTSGTVPGVDPEGSTQSILDVIAARCDETARDYGLSAREQQVLAELVRGRTLASIAETLVVSENTIKAHTKAIYRKLDVHTREELLARVEER